LNAAFWKQNEQKLGEILEDFETKFIKWAEKLVRRQICYFLGEKFPYAGLY
jgi:hypothetical protein